MSKLNISDLAGSDFFTTEDSLLTDLTTADTNQIIGGGGHKGGGRGKGGSKGRGGRGGSSKSGRGRGRGFGGSSSGRGGRGCGYRNPYCGC
jgi:hypothetical protein